MEEEIVATMEKIEIMTTRETADMMLEGTTSTVGTDSKIGTSTETDVATVAYLPE
jgi:hypothetical protein